MFGCSLFRLECGYSNLHERGCTCKENTYLYLILLLTLLKKTYPACFSHSERILGYLLPRFLPLITCQRLFPKKHERVQNVPGVPLGQDE